MIASRLLNVVRTKKVTGARLLICYMVDVRMNYGLRLLLYALNNDMGLTGRHMWLMMVLLLVLWMVMVIR